MEKDLTTGSVGKAVIRFSLPFLLSYFLQTLYGMADLFIIGQFNGVESTTAVSIGSQVMKTLRGGWRRQWRSLLMRAKSFPRGGLFRYGGRY